MCTTPRTSKITEITSYFHNIWITIQYWTKLTLPHYYCLETCTTQHRKYYRKHKNNILMILIFANSQIWAQFRNIATPNKVRHMRLWQPDKSVPSSGNIYADYFCVVETTAKIKMYYTLQRTIKKRNHQSHQRKNFSCNKSNILYIYSTGNTYAQSQSKFPTPPQAVRWNHTSSNQRYARF
jgi:hypothetical protein